MFHSVDCAIATPGFQTFHPRKFLSHRASGSLAVPFQFGVAKLVIATVLLDPAHTAERAAILVGVVLLKTGVHPCFRGLFGREFRRD